MRVPSVAAWALILPLLAPAAKAGSGDLPAPVCIIALNGADGQMGPIVADPDGKRLYVVGTAGDFVLAIDAERGKEFGRVDRGLGTPQGAAFLPDMGRLIVASKITGWIREYDADLNEVGAIHAQTANGVGYDLKTKLAYVGCYADLIAVIDPKKVQQVDNIRLDGHSQGFQLERNGNRIFVNVPEMQQIAVVDRQKAAVVAIWPLQDPRWSFPENFAMALDEEHHRLFVGCWNPAKLIVIDTDTGKIVSTVDCCPKVGDVYYDAERKRIYASGEEYVSVFKQVDPNTYKVLGFVTTGAGAVTSLFVPSTRKFYVAVPHRKLQAAKLMVFDCGTDANPTTAPAAAAAN